MIKWLIDNWTCIFIFIGIAIESYNWLDTIYKDSQMVKEEDLQTIRNRLRTFKRKETAF